MLLFDHLLSLWYSRALARKERGVEAKEDPKIQLSNTFLYYSSMFQSDVGILETIVQFAEAVTMVIVHDLEAP